jgi:hypothetical protein
MVVPDLPNRSATPPVPTAALCVHFAAGGAERRIDFTDAAPPSELDRAAAARLTVALDAVQPGLVRGRAVLRGEVACEAYLLPGTSAGPGDDRERLRSAGLPREWAALLARMPERPLLATVARGPDLSPNLLRRIHSLLITAAGGVALRCV